VLQRLRKVAEAKGANIAYLLDTKGPEIRTAMLREGKNLELKKDQEVLLVAVGHEYKTWEGGINPETGTGTRVDFGWNSIGALCRLQQVASGIHPSCWGFVAPNDNSLAWFCCI
jgi:pyruvate kinase